MIDRWADEVADAAADGVRHAVRADLDAGCGLRVALAAVRARMARLTPAQRERLVAAISAPAGS